MTEARERWLVVWEESLFDPDNLPPILKRLPHAFLQVFIKNTTKVFSIFGRSGRRDVSSHLTLDENLIISAAHDNAFLSKEEAGKSVDDLKSEKLGLFLWVKKRPVKVPPLSEIIVQT